MIILDDFRVIVLEALKSIQKKADVSISDAQDFTDYGLDSLDGMSLLLEIEKKTDFEFSESFDLTDHNSIELLYAYLEKNI